ncbi:anti-sigma regulatory factor [Pseudochryseolinea flava]|uniref:Histidine kinase/HSP90-like ATPase domain-containing protein n=1 Tax=Pseudochryseolinea flava TaxID=2059302 RepID=A0A364XWE1_9BACT|nr:anti-sigma regulatory factor [Pseudochryseolinea flava]RAV98707.1 hypothetical protein DQQ10_22080 [Pseudochryseolinea flava]
MGKPFASYIIEDRSYVSYVKRSIHLEASLMTFSPQQIGEIDIIVAEITSNLIKHAGGGELLYRMKKDEDDHSTFEIISLDKGPGMADVARMMKDGVSTKDTLGQGLGAIQRLSNFLQLYSIPGWGTILYAKVQTNVDTYTRKRDVELEIRALCVNKPRETVCGDGYRIKKTETGFQIFFGDGLGHGEFAKAAVDKAGDFFMQSPEEDPVEIIRGIHENVRRTRGLVATVANCNLETKTFSICGVGNILTRLYHGIVYRNHMPYNGTVGLNIPTSMKASEYKLEKNQSLIMSSDGIKTRWDINKYPAVHRFDPFVLATSIYKDFTRGNDDSSILIAKVI